MKRILFITAVIFIVAAQNIIFAAAEPRNVGEEVKTINLKLAAEMAVKTSEVVKQAGNNVRIAGELVREARAAWLPHVTGSISWINNARYPVNSRYPSGAIGDYGADFEAEVTQVLWAFGKISNAIAAAKKGTESAEYLDEASKLDSEYMGKMAFYNLIFAENIYRITLESYNNALESKKVLHERSSSGRVSRKDNIDIEADIASRATLVNDAKNDKKIAENNFKRITGLKESDSLILDGIEGIDTVKIDRKKMIRALLEREPSIKALGSKVNSSEELIKAARAEFFPTIAAFGDWTYSGMSDNRKYPHIGNKDQMDQIGVLGIKVDFPLWEGGARIARLNQARLDKSNTEWELVKVRNDLELELNNAISEYNEYINTLEANYKAVDLAEKTFKLFIELFASGQVSLLELNDAELMLTNEKIKREATIYGIRASRAKIERLTDIRI